MAYVRVRRDSTGWITQVERENTKRESVVTFAVFAGMFAGALHMFLVAVHEGRPVGQLGFVLVGSVYVMALIGRRFLPGAKPTVIATTSGIKFPFYSELGIVPWSAITGFRIVVRPGFIPRRGTAVLAELIEPDLYRAKLRSGNRLHPDRWRAPPFPTVATNFLTDLEALRFALEEFRRQELGQALEVLPDTKVMDVAAPQPTEFNARTGAA